MRDDAAGLCARLVRQWRGALTQQEFGARYGVPRQCVQHWEAGRRRPPVSVAYRMARDVDAGADHLAMVFGRLASAEEAP